MIGRTYLERGRAVTILARWAAPQHPLIPSWLSWHLPPKGAPRNVAIRRMDGTTVVRPFRGLRRTGGEDR